MSHEKQAKPDLQMSQAEIDDSALADFTAAMREKLARSRAKGRSGWQDPALCPEARLVAMLIGHLPKGNPGNFLDIAILAMMLHQRGTDPAALKEALSISEKQRRNVKTQCAKLGKSLRKVCEKFIASSGCSG